MTDPISIKVIDANDDDEEDDLEDEADEDEDLQDECFDGDRQFEFLTTLTKPIDGSKY